VLAKALAQDPHAYSASNEKGRHKRPASSLD
jgi:hypothetical protein